MRNKILWILVVVMPVYACSHKKDTGISEEEVRKTQEALIGANKLLIEKDRAKIVSYIAEHHLDMNESSTGLWYEILKEGSGEKVHEGNVVRLKYKVSLLDGTECYNSDSLGLKEFVAGRGGVESGLEEGILLLKKGSKAIFIIPPHLAHGLPGDGNRIPARSIIVYEVELLDIESS